MRPGLHDENIEIPLTFDVTNDVHLLPRRKIILGLFMFIGIVIISLVVFFLHISWLNAIIALIAFIVGTTALRLVWFDERYYRKCYAKLLEKGSKYEQDLVWDIYDIVDIPVGNDTLSVCRYRNGVSGVFVSFDKDITIGKGLENEYNHYEAISDAYQYIAQKGFTFMHIDYMDVVGKDERFDPVINELLQTPNEDLRQLLAATFEYQKFKMNRAYASYDVYCFYYSGDDVLFLSELDGIITRFMNANYIRYKILDMDGIRELVKSIYNLPEFSVYKACDTVLSKAAAKRFIKVRKVEKDGVVTVISKTAKEIAEEAYLTDKKKVKNKHKGTDNSVQKVHINEDEQVQGYGVQVKSDAMFTPIMKQNNVGGEMGSFTPVNAGNFTPIQSNVNGYTNTSVKNPFEGTQQGLVNPFEGVVEGNQETEKSGINNDSTFISENVGLSYYNPFNNSQNSGNSDITNNSENVRTSSMNDSNLLMSQKNFVYENNINGVSNNDIENTQVTSVDDEPIDW